MPEFMTFAIEEYEEYFQLMQKYKENVMAGRPADFEEPENTDSLTR